MNRQDVIERLEEMETYLRNKSYSDLRARDFYEWTGYAIKLLKAQESRLLTLDEVIEHYSLPPVFVDDLSMQEDYCMDIKPLYFDFLDSDGLSFVEHWRGYNWVRQYLNYWKASYGEKWVCWTDKPTDEQRKAVKWDG